MIQQTICRPPIPPEWYRPSILGTIAFLLYALALYLIPVSLLRLAIASLDSIVLQTVLIIPLAIIAAYGFQLIGFVGHEGLHLSLHRNKIISALIGIFFASSIVTYFEMGFAAHHWNHHRFTNQASDPDVQPVSHLKTWWQRLLCARAIYNFLYFKTTLKLALGHPLPFAYKLPFKPATVQALCWTNFAFSLFWLGVYTAIALNDMLTALFCIALPMSVTMLINACQIFIDHAGTSDELFRNTWSRTSLLMTAFYFGANYHLEHHLYPGVPCYRLHKIHNLLQSNGIYQQVNAFIEPGFFQAYRNVNASYTAGNDINFDPFKPAVE